MILDFIDQMKDEDFAVESACRTLHQQGRAIAARTYRYAKQVALAAKTVTDAQILDAPRAEGHP